MFAGNEAEETAKFIELVDKMFDSMNVSFLSEGKLNRKVFLTPYRKPDEFRLKVSNKFTLICMSVLITCMQFQYFTLL